jgi:hypothetical protein
MKSIKAISKAGRVLPCVAFSAIVLWLLLDSTRNSRESVRILRKNTRKNTPEVQILIGLIVSILSPLIAVLFGLR